MKKLTSLSFLAILFCQSAFSASQAEFEAAQRQAQAIAQSINASTSSNQGESIFSSGRGKDSTMNDFTKSSIRIDPVSEENTQKIHYTDYSTNAQIATQQQQLSEEQLLLLKQATRVKNLNALQQKFFNKKYSGFENTKHFEYEADKTQKIATRFAMATTLIFSTKIQSYVLGDDVGFEIQEMPNLTNAIAIKPKLIGIDTSLTVFTDDNKMHTFYLYSTDHKSKTDPNLVVHINDELALKAKNEKLKKQEDEYFIIKEGIAELKVRKDEMYANYLQKGSKKNKFLLAEEIFNDKQFTYFKYDKEKMPQIPSVFVVIDSQDTPIETRVIGNYVIAETTAKKFTIRLGDSYICVERLEPNDKRLDKVIKQSEKMNALFDELNPKTLVQIR